MADKNNATTSGAATASSTATTTQLHALATIKLKELSKLRAKLRAHFDKVNADAQNAASPVDKLRVLSDGLVAAETTFSSGATSSSSKGSAVGGGVLGFGDHQNLSNLIEQASKFPSSVASSTITAWIHKLESDVSKSLKRADSAWLFGKVLEEWVAVNSSAAAGQTAASQGSDAEDDDSSEDWMLMEDPQMVQQREDYIRDKVNGLLLSEPTSFSADELSTYLDELFEPFKTELADIRKQIASYCARPTTTVAKAGGAQQSTLTPRSNNSGLYAPVSAAELRSALVAILRDNLLGVNGKTQLRAIQASEELITEYSTVLTIWMVEGVEAWDWDRPSDDNAAAPSTLPTLKLHLNKALKIRPFIIPDSPLLALYHQIIGARLGHKIKPLLERFFDNSVMAQLIDKNYPDLKNTWPIYQSVTQGRNVLNGFLFCCSLPDKVEEQENTTGYGNVGPSGSNFLSKKQALLHWMMAELGLAKNGPALDPERAVKGVLVKGDVEDFYLSIPIDASVKIMEHFGFPPEIAAFTRRFLTPHVLFTPPSGPSSIQQIKRGIPLAHSMSRLISELILFVSDLDVRMKANGNVAVHSRRVVDDVHFFGALPEQVGTAWTAWKDSLRKFGLKENPKKCGSVAVVDDLEKGTEAIVSNGLPEGSITWNFLKLDPSSLDFKVDQEQLDSHLAKLKAKLLQASPSLLTTINLYNSIVCRDVVKMLGLFWSPSRYILEQGLVALDQVHGKFFDGVGMVDWIRKECSRRFGVEAESIPEAWICWPITAGGLGLTNPLFLITAVQQHMSAKAEREGPFHFEDVDGSLKNNNVEGTGGTRVKTRGNDSDEDDDYDGDSDYDEDYEDEDENENEEEDEEDEDEESDDEGEPVVGTGSAEGLQSTKPKPKAMTPEERGKEFRKWLRLSSDYGKVYTMYGNLHQPPDPTMTKHLSSLVEQFVDRGSEVKGASSKGSKKKKQVSLSSYYKWLLALMSEQVLDEFGSLGLTSTQLVPFALISQIRATDRLQAMTNEDAE